MGKTLLILGLTVCSLAASPTPKLNSPSGDDAWPREYARRFGRVPTPPATRPSTRDPIDGMPNALPKQFDLRMLPLRPGPQRPTTNPWYPQFNQPGGLRAIPPDWQRFKFNGEDVYIIPLKERTVETKSASR